MDQLSFTDVDSGDAGLVLVRRVQGGVGLALSLQSDGDIEVFLDDASAKSVATMIQSALGEAPA